MATHFDTFYLNRKTFLVSYKTLLFFLTYLVTDYEPLIELLFDYREFLMIEEPTQEQLETFTKKVIAFDKKNITNIEALTLYEDMLQDMSEKTAMFYMTQGMSFYSSKKYQSALPLFESAYEYVKDNPEIIYHLARVYHNVGNLEQAKELYKILIEQHQDSTRSQEAKTYLGYIGE